MFKYYTYMYQYSICLLKMTPYSYTV